MTDQHATDQTTPDQLATSTPPAGGHLAPYLPDRIGVMPMDEQRRHLLYLAVSALGLTVGGPLLSACGATPSHLEAGGNTATTLDRAETALYGAALGHMRPDTDPEDMHAVAAGVFRDVHTLLTGPTAARSTDGPALPERTKGRILYLEALAAAMVGSLYGHDRKWSLARPWFGRAKTAARQATAAGEVRGPGAEVLTDCLLAKVVLYMHPTQTEGAHTLATAAEGRIKRPRLGATVPAGSALAASLVARSAAARGNLEGAYAALERAARLMDAPGYFAAPFLDASVPVDGPMSLFGYGHRAHLFTECEVYAYAGDVPATGDAAAAYLHTPAGAAPASTTSTVSVRLLEARAMVAAGRPDEAAEFAVSHLAGFPDHAINAAVRARVSDLAELVGRHVEPSAQWKNGPVRLLNGFTKDHTGYLT